MSDKVKTVYIAGPITGDPNYKNKFTVASEVLRGDGFIVCNPVVMLKSLVKQDACHRDLVRIGSGIAGAAAFLALLPGWKDSKGALLELAHFMSGHHSDDLVYEFTMENARDLEGNVHSDIYSGHYDDRQVRDYYQSLRDAGGFEWAIRDRDVENEEDKDRPF